AAITIDVANVSAPVLTLTSPADGRKFAFGAAIPFAATATDSFDGDLSARILWTSDRDGALGTGASFNRPTLSRGTHTLTASITDTPSLTGSATTHVTVLAAARGHHGPGGHLRGPLRPDRDLRRDRQRHDRRRPRRHHPLDLRPRRRARDGPEHQHALALARRARHHRRGHEQRQPHRQRPD